MTIDPDTLRKTMESAAERLASEMNEDGCWEGHLSSSALSTAVAAFALWTTGERDFARRGLDWLVRHVNDDGGWGDTPDSPSNFTTTLLSWCAVSLVDPPPEPYSRTVTGADRWLRKYAGGTGPKRIVSTVISDYGSDRTFSAPILTMCAIAGKLGDTADRWSHVPALPFE
ncbi:MAG: terpene cyclase/mutase family protein, partial [Candidatus Hydrogenedentes bacterium]|nr:terpene cyclase/mutase family protein [Candidatus Hydrogenedentota bacterium]